MSTHGSPTTKRFVRTAWLLLSFQFVFAIGAVGAAVWAVSAVRTMVNERAMLQSRIAELEAAQNQVAPAPPPAEPGNVVVEEVPPAPVNEVAPAPAPTPAPAPAPPPPTRQPPVRQPPVRQPPADLPPVDTPPAYEPPPYTPPPRTDDKPPPGYDPPPERPRRPRPHIDIPGIFGGIVNSMPDRPDRPQRNPNNYPPSRTPGTNTNPSNPNNGRPPSTNGNNSTRPPANAQPPRSTNTNPIRRPRRRPQTNTQQPVIY